MAVLIIADATQQASMDALTARIDAGAGAGTIKIYDGTQATDPDDPIGTQVLLGTLTFSAISFLGADIAGKTTADTITGEASAVAGTATWARIESSTPTTVFDCDISTVAAGTGTIQLDNTTISLNGTIDLTAFTLTMPQGV